VQTELNLTAPQTTTVKPFPSLGESWREGRISSELTQESEHQPYTVIVVSYNSQYWLEKHLLFYQACQHLVIVDNASVDSTCDYVRSHLQQARLIANTKNQGFGAACNQGVACTTTPYALLLNPDCTCEHSEVEKLVAVAEKDPQAAIVAPQVMTKKGTPEVSYRMGLLAWKAKIKQAAQGLLCVEFVTGACLLLNKTAFDAVQGFDEAYFMYYEDEDLCLRLRRAGYSIVVQPCAVVQHFARSGSKSVEKTSFLKKKFSLFKNEYSRGKAHTESKLFFYKKYQDEKSYKRLEKKIAFSVIAIIPLLILLSPLLTKQLGRALGRTIVVINSSKNI
jgi:N-acetylglucosaminyl-diphospho-decaprenol L-rhamnosyltransferase